MTEELGLQADNFREAKQNLLAEAAGRTVLQSCINDMIGFLDEMLSAITEYSDVITRRIVE